jgi:hypothetical protein
MRTGTDDILDDERAEARFRDMLARFGEPADIATPPDLVTRAARRLPHIAPAQAARHGRRWLLAGIAAAALFALLALGAWAMLMVDPALAGQASVVRALLTLQLVLKPIFGILAVLGLPLLMVGVAAALGSGLVLDRHARGSSSFGLRA